MDNKKRLTAFSATRGRLARLMAFAGLLLVGISAFGQKTETTETKVPDSTYEKGGTKTTVTDRAKDREDPGGSDTTRVEFRDSNGVLRELRVERTYILTGKPAFKQLTKWDCKHTLIYETWENWDLAGNQTSAGEQRYENGKHSGSQWSFDENGKKTFKKLNQWGVWEKIAFDPASASISVPPPDNSVCPLSYEANQMGGQFLLIHEDSQPERFNTYGFGADYTHFFGEHWGLTGDVNVALGSQGGVDFTKTSYFGGVSVPFNNRGSKGVTLFAHALAGGAHLISQFGPASATSNSFAMKLGGGLDVKVAHHFSLRPIEVDYVPTFFGKSTQHNVSFSFGFVYKWGHPSQRATAGVPTWGHQPAP